MKNKKYLVILIITLFIFTSFLVFYKVSYKDIPLKCFERGVSGGCEAMIYRYQYNPVNKKCEAFLWGGCAGYVPFQDLNSCQKICEEPENIRIQ